MAEDDTGRRTTVSPSVSGSGKLKTTSSGTKKKDKKKGNGSKKSKSSSSDDKEWFDWIEVAIDRIERIIKDFARTAESTFKTVAERITAIGTATKGEIGSINKEIKKQQDAADRYFQQAEAVAKESGLSENLQKLVRSGKIDITKYSGDTLKKIKEYQKWYEKGLDAQKRAKELEEERLKLYKDRFELVQKEYELQIGQIDYELRMYDKRSSMSEYSGEDKPFLDMIQSRYAKIDMLSKEEKKLQKQLDKAVAAGIEVSSEDWYKMTEAIQKTRETATDAAIEIAKIYKEMFDDVQQKFEMQLSTIDDMLDVYDKQISSSYLTGAAKPFGDVIDTNRKRVKKLNEEAASLEKQLSVAMADPVNGIREGSREWFDMQQKITAAKSTAVDAAIAISQAYKDQFDDIGERYDRLFGKIDSDSQALQRKLDMLEAHGYMGGADIYRDLQDQERTRIEALERERKELQAQMDAATSAADGIRVGSAAWFEMQQKIDDATASLEQSRIELVKYDKQIRQLDWDTFDFIQDRISAITDESEFLIKLMESSKLFDDLGKFTDTGTATVGLHAQNFDVYMRQADEYFKELQSIEQQLADDPADTKLIERREELLKLQRDSILAANDEKEAIKDLVEEGIKIELDHLKDLIDKYEESLDNAKSLYEYQKNIAKQTKEIASLQKQLNAYQGDTSEENRARIQKLVVSLEDARENLRETQYDQYISDQKKLLDDLFEDYESTLNKRLDNVDELFRIMVGYTNDNSRKIYDTLGEQCSNVGTQLSTVMNNIWGAAGVGTSVVATYTSTVTAAVGAVANAINGEGGAATTIGSAITAEEEGLKKAIAGAEEGVSTTLSGQKTDLSTLETQASNTSGTVTTISTTLGALKSTVENIYKALNPTSTPTPEEQGPKATVSGTATGVRVTSAERDTSSKYQAGDYIRTSGKVGLRGDDLKFRRYTKESEGMKVLGEKTENGQKYYQVEYLSNKGEITTGWVVASKLEGASDKTQAGAYKAKVKSKKANLYMGNTNGGTFVADTATVAKGETFDYLRTVKDGNGTTYAEITYKNKRRYLKLSDIDVSGFTKGGYIADLQKLAYRNGDDMVTVNTLKKGEAVLTTAEAAQFRKLVESLPALQGAVDITNGLKELSTVPSGINGGGISVGDIMLNMPIDHVEDYDDLVRHMRDDKTFERMVKTIVLNPLSGKSSMAKKSYYN